MRSELFTLCLILLSLFGTAFSQIAPLPVNTLTPQVLQKYVTNTPLLQSAKNRKKWEDVSEKVKLAGGCDPNICFAIDGSASVPPNDYKLQLNFINLIVGVVGQDPIAMFAGTQFGREVVIISGLTGNAELFLKSVNQSTMIPTRRPSTFIEPGILFCFFQLGKQPGQPAKLVIFADGRGEIRDLQRAAIAAQDFAEANSANDVLAVGAEFDDNSILRKIVGSPDGVITTGKWKSIVNVLEDVVIQICDLNTSTPPAGGSSCPCKCVAAKDTGPKAKRKVVRKVRERCRKFKGSCSVKKCAKTSPVAFQCC